MHAAPSPNESAPASEQDPAHPGQASSRPQALARRLRNQVAASVPRPVVTSLSRLKALVRRIRATRAAQPLVASLFGPNAVSATLAATGDVLVTRVQPCDDPAIILKVASTESAARQIDLEAKALVELDHVLIDMTAQVPVARLLEVGTSPQGAWFTQSLLPGDPAAQTALSDDQKISMVAEALGPLYEATQRRVKCTPQVMHELIDRPLSAIVYWRPELSDKLNEIGTHLKASFGATDLTVCRIHGDLGPTNLLWQADTSAISGIVDWSFSSAHLVPEIDLVHLAITMLSSKRNQEYGTAVIELCGGEMDCSSLKAVHTALASGPNDLAIADAAILTWLHHVSFGLERQEQLRGNPVWLHHNLDAVVYAVTSERNRKSAIAS